MLLSKSLDTILVIKYPKNHSTLSLNFYYRLDEFLFYS